MPISQFYETERSPQTAASSQKDANRVPTGMSFMDGSRDSATPSDDDNDDEFSPVYVPEAFKKSREEKIND